MEKNQPQQEPYIPFEMVKGKIYCGRKGEIEGFGLKTVLSAEIIAIFF